MINFFRKIRKQLADDNKPLKYLRYAIGEILLVVIGILIALQINNWNEERKDKKLEVVVLNDIRDNIHRNNQLIKETITTIDQINVSADSIRAYLISDGSRPLVFTNNISEALRSGTFLFRLNTDGYESLKSTGFTILDNEGLKDRILNLFEVTYGLVATNHNFANSLYLSDVYWWKDYLYKIDPNKFVPYDLGAIRTGKRFLSEINEIYFARSIFQNTLKSSLAQSEEVLELIDQELSNR